jgi:hypothetical protein
MVRAFTPTPQELEESYTYKDHRIFKISVFEGHITNAILPSLRGVRFEK